MQNNDEPQQPSQLVIGIVLGVIVSLLLVAMRGGGW